MNTLKLLPILILSLFLVSTVSAVAVYGDWQGEIQSATITDGDSIIMSTDFISVNPPITLSIKLYNSLTDELVYSFEDSKVVNNYSFFNSYELTDSIYQNPGNYEVILTASDKVNSDSHTLNLRVRSLEEADTTAPVITLVGANPITLTLGTAYIEYGATATDNIDGDITGSIAITNPVNVYAVGSYTVRYNVQDNAGNAATEVTRTVNVVAGNGTTDTTAPVITLTGPNPINLTLGTTYIEYGATAFDNVDGDITGEVTITNPVNVYVLGTYTVLYSVSDNAGNSANATRTVNIVAGNGTTDTTAPVITLLGNNPISIALGGTYTDAGATAFDNFDGDLTSQIVVVNPVDTSIVGTYTITYNVQDSAGNAATEVTRTVGVYDPSDTTAPSIDILSPDEDKTYSNKNITFEVQVNEISEVEFSLDGASRVSMDFAGLSGTNFVFTYDATLTTGKHTLTFYATDIAGNEASESLSFTVSTSKSSSKNTNTHTKVVVNTEDEEEYLKQFEKKQVIYLTEDEKESEATNSWERFLNWFPILIAVIIVLIIIGMIMLRR